MNIFARTLGGVYSDRFAKNYGLGGRVKFLFAVLLLEGLALLVFSQMPVLILARSSMVIFSLFVQMSEGATYGVVPFINKKALGSVAGIVGAGGNAGAVGFLFRSESLTTQDSLLYPGQFVVISSAFAAFVRFSPKVLEEENRVFREAHAQKTAAVRS